MNQALLLKFGTWYLIITMLILAIVSIKAYRCSLKKIFILFMVISIPTFADKIYAQINLLTVKKFHNTIPNIILRRDIRNSSRNRSPSAQYQQMQEKIGELWKDSFEKKEQIEEKYSDAIAAHKKRTWLKDLWNNVVWRLSSWLFPIGAIIICINEIKSSNHRVDPTRYNAAD